MSLDTHATFPSACCYVLKLHRDAVPEQGRLMGRVEHIASGDHVDFQSGDELLAWVSRHVVEAGGGLHNNGLPIKP